MARAKSPAAESRGPHEGKGGPTTERARPFTADAESAYLGGWGVAGVGRRVLRLGHGAGARCPGRAVPARNLRLPEALRLAQRAVKAAQDLGQARQGRLLFALQTVAGIHRSAGRFDEAATLYRLALEKSIPQYGERHPATAAIQNNLAIP